MTYLLLVLSVLCLSGALWLQRRRHRRAVEWRALADRAVTAVVAAERPSGVRVVHPDATVTPVELAYVGIRDGIHMWSCITPFHAGDRLLADVLPPRTGITLGGDDA